MTKAIVIDDDEDITRVFCELLQEQDIDVVGKGSSGKEAVDIFESRQPDISFIDIMMPEGSGFYAIRKIREINPKAVIVAVTADNSSYTAEKLEKEKLLFQHCKNKRR